MISFQGRCDVFGYTIHPNLCRPVPQNDQYVEFEEYIDSDYEQIFENEEDWEEMYIQLNDE